MGEIQNLILRKTRRQSMSWSALDPEERSILTANQLSVQNQKVRKDLEVIHKGIEDEKRCGKAVMAKEELLLQNRLNRLSKASERINRLTRASLTNIDEAGNFFKSANSDERLLRRKYSLPTQTSSDFSSKLQLSKVRSSSQNVLSSEAQSDENISRTPSRSANKKRVRFGSTGIEREGSSSRHIETSLDSPRTSLLSSHDGMSSRSGQQPTDGLKLGSMLSYYNANLLAENLRRSSKGFSHNANSLPKAFRLRNSLAQSTGLEDEMNRWRRLHYTRSMNARLKAVRPLGRRHPVNVTLRDVMDANARMRKETALRSEQFTPENAWQMLNCRYLRLTRSNIEHLENVCEEAGYDISTHPHVSESQWVNVFKNT